jgi:4-hydroxybenzoate polyprenyltransferase
MAAFLVLGTAYSVPPARLKARPYLDFLSNVLYAVPGLLGYVHASGHLPPAIAVAAAAAWTGAMHLFSAIPDIEADRSAGLSTTAVVLGQRRSLMVCTALWSAAALGAVALAAGSGILVTALVATAAAVYPVASASLLRRPELVAGTYWRFPALNGLMGFALFVIAMLA